MPRYIIKLNEKYLIWSTIVDAPISNGMTKDELIEWIEYHNGQDGLFDLPDRLERVDAKGVSAFNYASVDELIAHNRAGPEESCLTKDEIIEQYVRNIE